MQAICAIRHAARLRQKIGDLPCSSALCRLQGVHGDRFSRPHPVHATCKSSPSSLWPKHYSRCPSLVYADAEAERRITIQNYEKARHSWKLAKRFDSSQPRSKPAVLRAQLKGNFMPRSSPDPCLLPLASLFVQGVIRQDAGSSGRRHAVPRGPIRDGPLHSCTPQRGCTRREPRPEA